jgi:hypothetical protein
MPVYGLTAFEKSGVESELMGQRLNPWGSILRPTVTNPPQLEALLLENHPRRPKSFGIRIWTWSYQSNRPTDYRAIGEFRLANPSRENSPGLQAELLPASRQTNGLEVRLLNLETGVAVSGAREGKWSSRAKFEFREHGEITTNWSTFRVRASSPSERRGASVWPASREPGDAVFPLSLWLDEPAWKLAVDVVRTAGFPPEASWTIKGFPLQEDGRPAGSELMTNLCGSEVRLMNAPALQKWEQGLSRTRGLTPVPQSPGVELAFVMPRFLWPTMTELKDNQGRLMRAPRPIHYTGFDMNQYEVLWRFRFDAAETAKIVDLTIGVSRSVSVEFCVKPTLAATNVLRLPQ